MGLEETLLSSNIETFNDGDIFELSPNLKFKAILTPGHTKGSCSFLLNDEVLFTGDSLFKNSMGRTDLFSGDRETSLNTIKIFKTMNPCLKVLPGHGDMTTLKYEFDNSPVFN